MSKKVRQYSYTKLADIKPNTIVDVYGVVKFFKPAEKCRGTDYRQVISIVDPSFHENYDRLVCVMFVKDKSKSIPVDIGSIVRFHRLKICVHNENLQGQSGPGFSWIVCEGENGYENPKSSSTSFTFTDDDITKVKDLYNWSQRRRNEIVNVKGPICIEDITLDLYFDLICQVVATCVIEAHSCFLIRVWDGTKNKCTIHEFGDVECKGDEMLINQAQGRTVDIALYDDHLQKAAEQNVSPGQFVKLVNVHATAWKGRVEETHQSGEMIELCLHQGTKYGRGAFVLDETHPSVIELKQRLHDVQTDIDNIEFSEVEIDLESLHSSNMSGDEEERVVKETRVRDNPLSRGESIDTVEINQTAGGKNNRMEIDCCMLETITVVNDHPHVKRTSMSNILNHSVPYKFRVLTRVVAYQPCPPSAESLVSLYCSSCHHIMRIDDQTLIKNPEKQSSNKKEMYNRFSDSSSSENSGRVKPKCPSCEEKNDGSEESVNQMSYIFMIRLMLHDGTSWLSANLWKDEAVTFLKEITPEDVIRNPKHETEVKQMLTELCPLDKPLAERPWLDVCLKSYTTPNGVMYQIFDTSIA